VSPGYRLFEGGPQFMDIDGHVHPSAKSKLVGRVLR
jgi:hypothetical protein